MSLFARFTRLVGVVMFVAATPAHALLLSPGSPLSFNLDFTGTTYVAVQFEVHWTPQLVAPQELGVLLSGGPDGASPIGGNLYSSGDQAVYFMGNFSELNDGIFSIRLFLNTGSVDVTYLDVEVGNLSATADAFVPLVPPVLRILIPGQVSEPSTLVLLVLALLAVLGKHVQGVREPLADRAIIDRRFSRSRASKGETP